MANKSDNYNTRATLLQKLKNKHDDESWQEFTFYYKGYIYMICRKMNMSHHDTEDIVQKVLIHLWNALPEFKYDSNQKFRAWLAKVTQYKVYNFMRAVTSQSKKLENAAVAAETHISQTSKFPDIDKIAEEEWKTYIVSMAFVNIKEHFSEEVLDVFEKLKKGTSNVEVAAEVGLPQNTIAVYKKRVTAKLRQEVRRLNHELG